MTDKEIEVSNALNIWARSTGRETIIQSVKDAFFAGYEASENKWQEKSNKIHDSLDKMNAAFFSTQELSESRRAVCLKLTQEKNKLRDLLGECLLELGRFVALEQGNPGTKAIINAIEKALK